MSKDDLLSHLNALEGALKRQETSLGKDTIKFITQKQTRQNIQSITKKWFEEIEPIIMQFGVSEITKEKYHELFTRLLELSLKTSRKNTYQNVIEEILVDFKPDIIIAVMKSAGQIFSISSL